MSAKKLYDALIASGIVGATGETNFELNGVKTRVNDSSIVGNVIQEWLQSFMDEKGIAYRLLPNTQKFPDFLMNPDNDHDGLLEVKCFKKDPNFDVANFIAYCTSLTTSPYRLDADYLIFKYKESETGIIIEKIWLKKVWEICSASKRTTVKIQIKQGSPYAIRPGNWMSTRTEYPVFATRKAFVKALEKVIDSNPLANHIQRGWFQKIQKLYTEQTGKEL